MSTRLTLRRATIGPRHSLSSTANEHCQSDSRPLGDGLPKTLVAQLLAAASEEELRGAANSLISFGVALLDHRQFIIDLDWVWPQTAACKKFDSGEVLTLTTAIKDSLGDALQTLDPKQGPPRRKLLSLFGLAAELCWGNYVSPSERVIRQALDKILGSVRACTFVNEGMAARYVEACAFFLARVGAILTQNPLEVYTVLDPLATILTGLASRQPRRTQWFVWVMLKRKEVDWAGAVYLKVPDIYWQQRHIASMIEVAAHKEDPVICNLASLPSNAVHLISTCVCTRNALDCVDLVWDRSEPETFGFAEWCTGLSATPYQPNQPCLAPRPASQGSMSESSSTESSPSESL